MNTEYKLVINEKNPKALKYALYRRGELVATWDHNSMIDNLAYVRKQAKLRIGASGDSISEENVSWDSFPEVYPIAAATEEVAEEVAEVRPKAKAKVQ